MSQVDWRQAERDRLCARFDTDVFVFNGVARWKTNWDVPPADVCDLWEKAGKPFDPEATRRARESALRSFVAEYRTRWKPPNAEQVSEMQAAGLEGPVVDVVAGRLFDVPKRGSTS